MQPAPASDFLILGMTCLHRFDLAAERFEQRVEHGFNLSE